MISFSTVGKKISQLTKVAKTQLTLGKITV